MLRHVLGRRRPSSPRCAQYYAPVRATATATTEDFRDVCEAVSGRDLRRLLPAVDLRRVLPASTSTAGPSAPAAGGYDVTLTLRADPDLAALPMPVDVTVTTAAGDADLRGRRTRWPSQDLHAPRGRRADRRGRSTRTTGSSSVLEAPVVGPAVRPRACCWSTASTGPPTAPRSPSAYTDHAFSGDYPIDFWDNFGAPAGGYPATLPAPLGHGAVPARGDRALPERDLGRQQLQRRPAVVAGQPDPLVPARGRERAAHGAQGRPVPRRLAARLPRRQPRDAARRSTTASPRARAWATSRGSAPRASARSSTPSARAPTPSCSTRRSRTTRPTAGSASCGSRPAGGTAPRGRRALRLPLRPALPLEPRESRRERRVHAPALLRRVPGAGVRGRPARGARPPGAGPGPAEPVRRLHGAALHAPARRAGPARGARRRRDAGCGGSSPARSAPARTS